jgi:hypothetical protein
MDAHATSASPQTISAILCGLHGDLHKTRSIGHRARRHRAQKARQIHQPRRCRKSGQERCWKLPCVGRRHQPRARLAPDRARQESLPPPTQPAPDRARWDARRATQRTRRLDQLPLHAGQHDRHLRVHAPAQKPHRRRRRTLAAPFARAAEAMPPQPPLSARSDQPAPWFAGVVRPIQPRAARRTPRHAHCLGGLRVDRQQLHKKMDIHPELVRVGDTWFLHKNRSVPAEH